MEQPTPATRDGQPAGYLVVTFGDAFIDELFVAEQDRDHGAGTRALDFAAPACRRSCLHLEVDRSNARAQRL